MKSFSVKLLACILLLFSGINTYAQQGVIQLTNLVNQSYEQHEWVKSVEYADQAKAIDSIIYAKNISWGYVGVCRYQAGDFKGAINDFNRFYKSFIALKDSTHFYISWESFQVEEFKVKAHVALKQLKQAADTYAWFVRHGYDYNGYQKAAMLYKVSGNNKAYRCYMDSAIVNYQALLESLKNSGKNVLNLYLLDYTELLILADKPAEALSILNSKSLDCRDGDTHETFKTLLQVMSALLIDKITFNEAKITLINMVNFFDKIPAWDCNLFNNWLKTAKIPNQKKMQLCTLHDIAHDD